jgi:hypothetical protein
MKANTRRRSKFTKRLIQVIERAAIRPVEIGSPMVLPPSENRSHQHLARDMAGGGIEPPTRGFSVLVVYEGNDLKSVVAQKSSSGNSGFTVSTTEGSRRIADFWLASGLALFAALVFYFTTKPIMAHFNYTHRLALAFLDGRVGLKEHPSWLNELIPLESGDYTGAYCFGAILSIIPFLFLSHHLLIALIAGTCAFFFFLLAGVEGTNSTARRTMLALFPVFGTWTWADLGFAGAWQITEGFAMLGQTGALYFTLMRPKPVVAGAFFALAFGNRAELLLVLPIYLLLTKQHRLHFLIVPAVLALFTAEYNFSRFHSPFDFGYLHIPGAMSEPWCQQGLFAIYPIRYNAYHMLFEGWNQTTAFPFMLPSPWGCSIFLASPFLFLLFRDGGSYKVAAWTAIGLLTAALWCHCNQGGWQFSYRYAMTLLPWMFLVLAGNGRLSVTEIALFAVSVAINGVATWLFLWTNQIHV